MFFKIHSSNDIQTTKTAKFSFTFQIKKDAKIFAIFGVLLILQYMAIQGTSSEKNSFLLIDLTYFIIPLIIAGTVFCSCKKEFYTKRILTDIWQITSIPRHCVCNDGSSRVYIHCSIPSNFR